MRRLPTQLLTPAWVHTERVYRLTGFPVTWVEQSRDLAGRDSARCAFVPRYMLPSQAFTPNPTPAAESTERGATKMQTWLNLGMGFSED